MKKFQVFDTGKPAQFPYCEVSEEWDNSIFNTFSSAKEYALRWIGYREVDLKPDVPFDYSGLGDTIEIRTIS